MPRRAAWSSKGVVFLGVDALDFKGPARAYMKRSASAT